jgi:protein-S-isoprenylcysteine O-methyltransferase Ste14
MIVFIIIWSAWFLSEILLNRILRSQKGDMKGRDRGSIVIIWLSITISISAGIIINIFSRTPISNLIIIPFSGLFLILIGMTIRFVSIFTLGRFFTVDVTIRENHRIKKDGIYGLIRHPSYLGSIISFIGFGISLNNWISLIIISVFTTGSFLYRITVEEKLLTDYFGDEYIKYKNETKRLIPRVY